MRTRATPATPAATPLGATAGLAEDRTLNGRDSRSVEAALLRHPGPDQQAGAQAEGAAERAGHPETGERPPRPAPNGRDALIPLKNIRFSRPASPGSNTR